MTLEKWYPEMPCEACKQEVDTASTDKNKELEHQNEWY